MSEEHEVPDWILNDEFKDEPPTPEEVAAAWDEFLELDLVGRLANFSNMNGDMYELEGTVSNVYKEGDEIVMILDDVVWFDWTNPSTEGTKRKDLQPYKTKREEKVLLATEYPPRPGNTADNAIILPGAKNFHAMHWGIVEPI